MRCDGNWVNRSCKSGQVFPGGGGGVWADSGWGLRKMESARILAVWWTEQKCEMSKRGLGFPPKDSCWLLAEQAGGWEMKFPITDVSGNTVPLEGWGLPQTYEAIGTLTQCHWECKWYNHLGKDLNSFYKVKLIPTIWPTNFLTCYFPRKVETYVYKKMF